MTDTTNTSANTAQKENSKAIPLLGELDMRDYFAAKAIRPQPTFPRSLWQAIKWALGFRYEASRFCPEQYAKQCYQQADAMLKARKS